MTTQVAWGTFARVTGGISGTAPELFVGCTDQTEAVILTAGAVANQYTAKVIKAGDIIYINYDQDGTPGQDVYTVTATSGGSLVIYPNATGGALLAANNLDDVANVATSAHNLGLGTADSPTFTAVTASTGNITATAGNVTAAAGFYIASAANALTAHAGGGQGSALALTKQFNRVTTVGTAADSVKLPAATAGKFVVVINAAASNAMDVFPASGEVINALSADTALSVSANKCITFFCAVAGTWNSQLTG